MNLQAGAVADTVGESGQLIIGTQAGGFEHLARCVVDRGTGSGDLRGVESRLLCCLLQIPDLPMALGGLTVDIGSRNIGDISVELASGVDEDYVVVLEIPRRRHAVRILRIFTEKDDAKIGPGSDARTDVRLVNECSNIRSGDPRVEDPGGGAVNLQGDVVGSLEDGDFCVRLAHAAGCGHRFRADEGLPRVGLPQPFRQEEGSACVDANPSCFDVFAGEEVSEERKGALMLFPTVDRAFQTCEIPEGSSFESGADVVETSVPPEERSGHSL